MDVNPNGNTFHCHNTLRVANAVFSLSLLASGTCQYPLVRSKVLYFTGYGAITWKWYDKTNKVMRHRPSVNVRHGDESDFHTDQRWWCAIHFREL